tara:strand:+ start:774 stop:1250 length:477 start_codon:yes stop_codon:yes gene_type:complete
MGIVVENGSVVSGANSYVSLAEYRSWANDRGILTSDSDSVLERAIFRAMDYFESLQFIGNKANENQPLQWPRTEALIDGYYVDATEIPGQVKKALYEAAYVQQAGNSELNTQDRKASKEKIGDIEVTYADNSENRIISPALTFALSKIVRPAVQVSRT